MIKVMANTVLQQKLCVVLIPYLVQMNFLLNVIKYIKF